MSIKVAWDNDKHTVVYYNATGSWNWIEFDNAVEWAFKMTEGLNHAVDTIFDLGQHAELPHGALLHFRRWLSILPPTRGKIVIVSSRESTYTLVHMLRRIDRKVASHIAITNSLDTARRMLSRNNIKETPFIQERMKVMSAAY